MPAAVFQGLNPGIIRQLLRPLPLPGAEQCRNRWKAVQLAAETVEEHLSAANPARIREWLRSQCFEADALLRRPVAAMLELEDGAMQQALRQLAGERRALAFCLQDAFLPELPLPSILVLGPRLNGIGQTAREALINLWRLPYAAKVRLVSNGEENIPGMPRLTFPNSQGSAEGELYQQAPQLFEKGILELGRQRVVLVASGEAALLRSAGDLLALYYDLGMPVKLDLAITDPKTDLLELGCRAVQTWLKTRLLQEREIGFVIAVDKGVIAAQNLVINWSIRFHSSLQELLAEQAEQFSERQPSLFFRLGFRPRSLVVQFGDNTLVLKEVKFGPEEFKQLGFHPKRYRSGVSVWEAPLEEIDRVFGEGAGGSPARANYNLPFDREEVAAFLSGDERPLPSWCRRVIIPADLPIQEREQSLRHELAHDLWFGGGLTRAERESFRRSVTGWLLGLYDRVKEDTGIDFNGGEMETEPLIGKIRSAINFLRGQGQTALADELRFFTNIDWLYTQLRNTKNVAQLIRRKPLSSTTEGKNLDFELFAGEAFAYGVEQIFAKGPSLMGKMPERMRQAFLNFSPPLFRLKTRWAQR